MRLLVGNEYELEIESISSDGNGVGHIEHIAVFVPFTAPGDRVLAKITNVRKSYAEAYPVNIVQKSPVRVNPVCPVFYECGGCSLMHMNYCAQLEEKRSVIENAMQRIGGFTDFRLDKILGMSEPFRYRNKMIFHAGSLNGKIVFGFYAPRTHRIIPLGDCMIGDIANSAIIGAVTEYMERTGLSPYDEQSGRGSVRAIFTRRAKVSGNIMVVLSVRGSRLPNPELLMSLLLKAVPEIKSIIFNMNKSRGNHGLGSRSTVLYGAEYIEDTISGISFRISPHSFFQVNPEMTEALYSEALDSLELDKNMNVLDLYCGAGTISLLAAQRAGRVIGIESVEQAVADARVNARINSIGNADFYAAPAEQLVPELIAAGVRPDAVILDPPRRGAGRAVLDAIIEAAPERIAYVSCNPATLARDAAILREGGYAPMRSCGVDMFPHSAHVETVVCLSKQKPDDVMPWI